MVNKIEILKTCLPAIMVEQRFNTIYIKICDRFHNLTEEKYSDLEKEEKKNRI